MAPADETSDLMLNAHLDSAFALEGLNPDPAWRPVILDHFRAIERAARLVLAYPLEDHLEAAPIFEP